ncbi:MAG: chemotaxis protein CheB [Betaproteobacteria bacterium]|nr:chemotaxis protein CheB [Betaproteobacteria bacterium]MBV9362524.1 chemotaxis protein CheB [Betaproteobacteria bacterium]
MAKKDIIVVGASAGGMGALEKLVAGLPADFPAAIFVVWHLSPGVKSVLPAVMSRAGPVPAVHPRDGDPIQPGHIYVAPNDHHLLLERGYVRVTKGPKENRFRPAVDPLFRSAAYIYGPRVVGVVLSGALDDGTAGLWAIKMRGGTAVVQDPADAMHRSMPLSALDNVEVDYKVPVAEIGPLLARLTREEAAPEPLIAATEREKMEAEVKIAREADSRIESVMQYGQLSPFTCPECHGVLTMFREGNIVRFRCHTGHALSNGTLLEAGTEQVEQRLMDAVRALDETIMLLNQLGEQYAKQGNTAAAEQCFTRARDAYERSRPIREAALANEELTTDDLRQAQG